jgi:hypothetical protein
MAAAMGKQRQSEATFRHRSAGQFPNHEKLETHEKHSDRAGELAVP